MTAMANLPLTEDLSFIGSKRRCGFCDLTSQMYWIPDSEWLLFVPEHLQRKHICFTCFLRCVTEWNQSFCDETLVPGPPIR